MKKQNLVFLPFVLVIFAGCDSCAHSAARGNGNVITTERAVGSFNSIQVNGSASVYYHASENYRVVLTVDSNLERYVETTVRNNTLNIGIRRHWSFRPSHYVVDVYAPSLNGISMPGSVRFEAVDKITTSAFSAKITGSGSMKGNVECGDFSLNISGSGEILSDISCNNFTANISGSGKITVNGNGNEAKIKISGSGVYEGSEFEIKRGTVGVSGSGKVNINASEYLNVNISGSGSLKYRGNPKIDYRGAGSGRIQSE